MSSGRNVDWSKAGTRIRHTPRAPGGSNPDWDWVNDRWKDEADYAADAMEVWDRINAVSCLTCNAPSGIPCIDARGNEMYEDTHPVRRRHAGEKAVANGKS